MLLDTFTIVCHNYNDNGHISKIYPSPKVNNSNTHALTTKPSINMTNTSSQPTQAWLIDSSTINYLTTDLDNLVIDSEYIRPEEVTLGNYFKLPISNVENSCITLNNHKFSLHNILRVPSATQNLLYVNALKRSNPVSMEFFVDHFLRIWT